MTFTSNALSGHFEGDFVETHIPYQAGIKVLAAVAKLKRNKEPFSDLYTEIRKQDSIISKSSHYLETICLASVLSDLFANEWDISYDPESIDDAKVLPIKLYKPKMLLAGESHEQAKERARKGLLIGVEEYLSKETNQNFVLQMESGVILKSITEVIDDPKDLAEALTSSDPKKVIKPYIEVVEEGKRDETTNHLLSDIWRYCRLTWSMEYKTNPGRSIRILIRNRARKGNPIMGIVLLASPVISLGSRDEAMGLTYPSFMEFVKEENLSLMNVIQLMEQTLKTARNQISKKGMNISNLSSRDLYEYLKTLSEDSLEARKQALSESNTELATDLLFTSKRALRLNTIQKTLDDIKLLKNQTKAESLSIDDVNQNNNFIELVSRFLTQKKNNIISTDIMDLSVCGAIFPYNSLLVGKLITLLMASNKIKELVDDKYADSENIIASKMAGKKLNKKTSLKALTTTSLYGVGSSQYNRLKLTQDNSNIKHDIVWRELRNTKGYGSFHFSRQTRDLLNELESSKSHQNVNYQFGEGTSPALRRIQEGLNSLGMKKGVFQHEFERKTYLCELTPNLKRNIFGLEDKKIKLNTESSIVNAWLNRYFVPRLGNKKIIESLKVQIKEDFLISKKWKQIFKKTK